MSITDNATGGVNEPEDFNKSESQDNSQGVTKDTRAANTSEDTGAESQDSANDNSQGFAHLGLPGRRAGTVGEAPLNEAHHNAHGRGSPGRSTQQRGNGAIGGGYHFGTKFQHATSFWVFFNNLYTLTGNIQIPVFFFYVREIVAQVTEAGLSELKVDRHAL